MWILCVAALTCVLILICVCFPQGEGNGRGGGWSRRGDGERFYGRVLWTGGFLQRSWPVHPSTGWWNLLIACQNKTPHMCFIFQPLSLSKMTPPMASPSPYCPCEGWRIGLAKAAFMHAFLSVFPCSCRSNMPGTQSERGCSCQRGCCAPLPLRLS